MKICRTWFRLSYYKMLICCISSRPSLRHQYSRLSLLPTKKHRYYEHQLQHSLKNTDTSKCFDTIGRICVTWHETYKILRRNSGKCRIVRKNECVYDPIPVSLDPKATIIHSVTSKPLCLRILFWIDAFLVLYRYRYTTSSSALFL